MRIFVAGSTGYVGSAVVRALAEGGHDVLGLARSDASAAELTRLGVEVHRGDIEDLSSLRSAVALVDGVVYAANKHISETTDNAARAAVERSAVESIGEELAGTGRPFVLTSGLIGRSPGHVVTEDAVAVDNPLTALRMPVERSAIALAARGVRSSSVRLSPTVHGEGDSRGFISILIGIARATGFSAFVGDGSNRWPAVHRDDAATLFRLATESAPAGTSWHAAAEEGIPFRDIADAIGRGLGLPVESITSERAAAHFGVLGALVELDSPASSALTRERLGWTPTHPGLIADIDEGHYFRR
jgi:nucleoside-diphosphate-sugar epimerase